MGAGRARRRNVPGFSLFTHCLAECVVFFVEDASTVFIWTRTDTYDGGGLAFANLVTTIFSAALISLGMLTVTVRRYGFPAAPSPPPGACPCAPLRALEWPRVYGQIWAGAFAGLARQKNKRRLVPPANLAAWLVRGHAASPHPLS